MTPPSIDRLHDLLARQATEPLTVAEEAELASLLAKWPHVDPEAFELAAAAVELALAPADAAPLPPALTHAVAADAAAYCATPPARRTAFRPLGIATPPRPRGKVDSSPSGPGTRRSPRFTPRTITSRSR